MEVFFVCPLSHTAAKVLLDQVIETKEYSKEDEQMCQCHLKPQWLSCTVLHEVPNQHEQ